MGPRRCLVPPVVRLARPHRRLVPPAARLASRPSRDKQRGRRRGVVASHLLPRTTMPSLAGHSSSSREGEGVRCSAALRGLPPSQGCPPLMWLVGGQRSTGRESRERRSSQAPRSSGCRRGHKLVARRVRRVVVRRAPLVARLALVVPRPLARCLARSRLRSLPAPSSTCIWEIHPRKRTRQASEPESVSRRRRRPPPLRR